MAKIKYDADLMKIISLFESLTATKLKDCISNDKLIFIAEKDQIGKAIGKNGANIKRLENILKRKIRIVEFDENVVQFVKNLIYPINAKSIEESDSVITITGHDTKSKGILIGRDRQNINNTMNIVKRYFDVKDVKIA